MASQRLGIATAIDLMCVDAAGRPCLVEQKCGFVGYNERSNGRMLFELATFDNSPQHQHQLQLALTTWLFFKTFGVRIRSAYVVRVVEGGVHFQELNQSFLDAAPSAIRRVAAAAEKL